jgi:hypothetical protein
VIYPKNPQERLISESFFGEGFTAGQMDTLIWINTLFLIFGAVAEGIILYVVLHEVRKGKSRYPGALKRSRELSE